MLTYKMQTYFDWLSLDLQVVVLSHVSQSDLYNVWYAENITSEIVQEISFRNHKQQCVKFNLSFPRRKADVDYYLVYNVLDSVLKGDKKIDANLCLNENKNITTTSLLYTLTRIEELNGNFAAFLDVYFNIVLTITSKLGKKIIDAICRSEKLAHQFDRESVRVLARNNDQDPVSSLFKGMLTVNPFSKTLITTMINNQMPLCRILTIVINLNNLYLIKFLLAEYGRHWM